MSLGKKILYSGLGWAMGGPIGAILGFAYATLFDQSPQQYTQKTGRRTIPRTGTMDFMASLMEEINPGTSSCLYNSGLSCNLLPTM